MGILSNSYTWITTNYILITMSRLVSLLLFISLMVMVVAENDHQPVDDCLDDSDQEVGWVRGRCEREKREALDASMTHKTKRGSCPKGTNHCCFFGGCGCLC